jgi:predicted phage tail protein
MSPTRTASAVDDLTLNIDAFERHLEAEGKSPLTVAAYRKATDQLSAHLRAKAMPLAVAHIRREQVEDFLIDLRHRVSPATVSQRFRSRTLTRAPAMAAGVADHVWTCEEIAALLG